MLTKKLINFELKVKKVYENGKIKAPIHLSGNNEKHLIKIFKKIKRTDWVFSTWRNHYHALLHGVDENWLYKEIIMGRSMGIISKKNKFYSSAIVGGILPIALGVAKSIVISINNFPVKRSTELRSLPSSLFFVKHSPIAMWWLQAPRSGAMHN